MYGKISIDSYKFYIRKKGSSENEGTPFAKIGFSINTIKEFVERFEPKQDLEKNIILRLPPESESIKAVQSYASTSSKICGFFYVGFYGRGAEQGDISIALKEELKETEKKGANNVSMIPYFYFIHIPTDPTDREGYLFLQRNGRNSIQSTFDKNFTKFINNKFPDYRPIIYPFVFPDALERFKDKYVKSFVVSAKRNEVDPADRVNGHSIFNRVRIELHIGSNVDGRNVKNIKNLFGLAKKEAPVQALNIPEEYLDVMAVLGETGHPDKRVKKADDWKKFKPDSNIDEIVKKDSNENPVFASIKNIAEELLEDMM